MVYERSVRRYRNWYGKLLRFYPKPYRERFGEGMEQTFSDLCRERKEAGGGLFGFTLWVFVETSAAIIKENIIFIIMHNKNIIRIALGTAFILMIPLVAMQFTDEVAWDLADFVIIGALLLGTGLMYELITRKVSNIKHRSAIGVALVVALLYIWAELAVGIFTNWGS